MSLLNNLKMNLRQRAEFIEAAVYALASRAVKKKEGLAIRETLAGGGGVWGGMSSSSEAAKRGTIRMSMSPLMRDSLNPKASLENSVHDSSLRK